MLSKTPWDLAFVAPETACRPQRLAQPTSRGRWHKWFARVCFIPDENEALKVEISVQRKGFKRQCHEPFAHVLLTNCLFPSPSLLRPSKQMPVSEAPQELQRLHEAFKKTFRQFAATIRGFVVESIIVHNSVFRLEDL